MADINELMYNLSQGEYAYLIGNGINRANRGDDWNQLLKNVVSSLVGSGTYIYDAIGKNGITNTEIQNIIPLEYNRKKGSTLSSMDLMRHVCKNISIIDFPKNRMLDYIKRNKAEILTTNYDFNIENYFWKGKKKRKRYGNNYYKTSNYYPWDCCYCERTNNKDYLTSKIWHIHGDVDHWQSIILSLSRYIGASDKARKQINLTNQTLELEKCMGTWLHTFFTKPLVIAGLALDPQEFFLRFLLILRAEWIRSHGVNILSSFYLSRATDLCKESGKIQFLKFLGIKCVSFGDDNVFDNPIWN